MKYFILAGLVASLYASPIQVFTATGTPIPTIDCPNSLCASKADGNYRHPGNPRYHVACLGGVARGCQRCAEDLVFNEICNQCRLAADADSTVCDFYTGSTSPNNACTNEDKAYAILFCQNLHIFHGAAWKDKSGDFAFNVYDVNPPNTKIGTKTGYYISCVEGMYGWCRFCPSGLVWYPLKDEQGNVKPDCGICDYPATAAP